ncbi:MAG: hypothetical protein ABIP38_08015 [Steroidobacteraceae bacterium]
MKTRVRIIVLLLTAWCGAAQAAEWQIVLLKPRGCDNCSYVEELLKRSSQLQRAVLEDGAGGQVVAPIQRRASAELSAQEWTQLRALPWFDESLWRQRVAARAAQVLLKRDGVIVSAGDIADSADLRNARFPPALNMPDAGSDLFAVRSARADYAGDLFLRSWNLNWFYRLALDPSLHSTRKGAAWIAANPQPLPTPLAAANVFLMSTASGAADNEIFNALRIEEIRDLLAQTLAFDAAQLRIFYGGDNAHAANALEVRGGRIALVQRNVAGASPFTSEAAARIFQSIRARPGSRNLLVLIGHGNPDGAGMWGSPAALSPDTLRSLHEHGGGDDVLVSGNCFGGVMARAMSCGFFGARPDIIATGCQADAAEVAQSRDYLHMFFGSLAARKSADADGDDAISFAEAHWYASTEGDPRNVTYTSIDALADAWFDTHPEALPRSLSVGEIRALAAGASPAEARTVRNLLGGYNAELAVPLDDLAGQATRWRPETGAPRAVVSQLARRLLYLRSSKDQGPELGRLQSCENRDIAAFLKP